MKEKKKEIGIKKNPKKRKKWKKTKKEVLSRGRDLNPLLNKEITLKILEKIDGKKNKKLHSISEYVNV